MKPSTSVEVAQEFIESYEQMRAALQRAVDSEALNKADDLQARSALANARNFAIMRGGRS